MFIALLISPSGSQSELHILHQSPLASHHGTPERPVDSGQLDLQILCRQIQQQPEKRWLLTELAAEYGYSPDYFGRLFSAIVGSPLSEYILTVRINQAKLLLRDSDSNIHEISDQLGYKDSGFFCRQFKKKTGISPAAYRKTLQTARNNLIPKRKPRLEK